MLFNSMKKGVVWLKKVTSPHLKNQHNSSLKCHNFMECGVSKTWGGNVGGVLYHIYSKIVEVRGNGYSQGSIAEGQERSSLCEDFDNCKRKRGLPWIVGGDFNMVLSRFEGSREHFSRACANEFKETLDWLDLMDLSLIRGKWTWSN